VILATIRIKAQLVLVKAAFYGGRTFSDITSAAYGHITPSLPMASKVLKMNKGAAATIPCPVPPAHVIPARTAMDPDTPTKPNSMTSHHNLGAEKGGHLTP
jgi:hypothetical protein